MQKSNNRRFYGPNHMKREEIPDIIRLWLCVSLCLVCDLLVQAQYYHIVDVGCWASSSRVPCTQKPPSLLSVFLFLFVFISASHVRAPQKRNSGSSYHSPFHASGTQSHETPQKHSLKPCTWTNCLFWQKQMKNLFFSARSWNPQNLFSWVTRK